MNDNPYTSPKCGNGRRRVDRHWVGALLVFALVAETWFVLSGEPKGVSTSYRQLFPALLAGPLLGCLTLAHGWNSRSRQWWLAISLTVGWAVFPTLVDVVFLGEGTNRGLGSFRSHFGISVVENLACFLLGGVVVAFAPVIYLASSVGVDCAGVSVFVGLAALSVTYCYYRTANVSRDWPLAFSLTLFLALCPMWFFFLLD